MSETERLDALFGMYSEAVIAIDSNEIIYYNCAAQKLLPEISKMKPGSIIPQAILDTEPDSFIGEVNIAGKRSTYSVARLDKLKILSVLSTVSADEGINPAVLDAISGEMKNYLAVLRMAATAVLPYVENSGDEKLSQYAAMINQSYYHILRLTKNAEILGDDTTSNAGLKKSVFDFAEMCGELVDACAYLVEERAVKLSFTAETENMLILADRDKIELMLLNMISNSISNTPAGGSVVISVAVKGETALIKVTDTGSGLSDEIKTSVWSRYTEPKTLSDTKSGAGFGMAVVSQIARIHDGSVFIESRKGEGTTVAVSIPNARKVGEMNLNDGGVSKYHSKGASSYLVGLATILGHDKFTQKFMD